jgi:hypothetical protein
MNLPVEVHLPGDDGPLTSNAHTRDVSFRGLYLTMAEAPKVGSPLDFIITLPREITMSAEVRIRCVGRVVRVEPETEGGPSANGDLPVGVAAVIEQYAFLPIPAVS